MDNLQFIQDLVVQLPILKNMYEEHIQDYDELLPHVFLGELTEFIIQLSNQLVVNSQNTEQLETLASLLDFLRRGMDSESEQIQNLIAVSFVENLDFQSSGYSLIKNLAMGSLKHELISLEEVKVENA